MTKRILLVGLMLVAVAILSGDHYVSLSGLKKQLEVPITKRLAKHKKEPVIELCSALSEDKTYGDDNSFKYLISGKDGWIFRTEMDLKHDIELSDWSRTSFARLQTAFKSRGISLAITMIPTRGLVGYDRLIGEYAQTYDHALAQERYNTLLDELENAGYIVADMRDVHQEKHYFLKRDNHWTAIGAQYSAQKMAQAIMADDIYASLKKTKYETTSRKITKDDHANDRFLSFVEDVCGTKPAEEALPAIYSTAPVGAEAIEEALFADASDPEVVLLGTSNSTRLEPSYANFVGFLKEELSVDIKNEAVTGGAFRGSIANYVAHETYKKDNPKLIVWELSAHYGFDQKATFREVIPTLYGECSDQDALALADGMLQSGDNYIFDGLENAKAFSPDYYLYLEVKNKDLREFKIDFHHADDEVDKYKVKRSAKNFPENVGRYFVELKDGLDFPLKKVNVRIDDKEPGQYEAKICRVSEFANL